MDQPVNEKTSGVAGKVQGKPRILVAPLDWGLGHATRCIPVIRELMKQGADVWLGAEGAQEKLLKLEFPELPLLSLAGYRIQYARTAGGLLRNILMQTPGILRSIKAEKEWLKKIITRYSIDGVIADNRYGLCDDSIPCIFITHQLTIKTPFGKWAEQLLQKRNYGYINRFAACWVPDVADDNNLAGELSHPLKKPTVPVNYIGILSRFEPIESKPVKEHLLVLLSGPEPQRSILENKILKEIAHYPGTATIVRGLPGGASIIPSTNMLRFYNHLPATELHKEILDAAYVIGRCGYSTVMDLVSLNRKGILVPTPGQTEQEYLASYLTQRQIACCIGQKDFSIIKGLQKAKEFAYASQAIAPGSFLKENIASLLTACSYQKK